MSSRLKFSLITKDVEFMIVPRIAIVHDWLVTFAGAERVLAEILGLWPEADLFAVIDFLTDAQRELLAGKHATTTFIQNFPGVKRQYQKYLPLMPIAIEQLDLKQYDIVISSSHAVAKGVLTGPDQLHICYCHSPMRYAWDMQSQYLRESRLERGIKSWFARYLLYKLRGWDYRSGNGVDHFISNSDYIGRRIKKVYRRESTTIYPGVDIGSFELVTSKSDFYLTASRLVPYKNVEVIVRAFNQMPDKQLIVIGEGPQLNRIRSIAGENVRVLGYQSFDSLKDHMQRARAFVYAAEEDFGIVPVEAQACGTPVIAYARGGALETVVDGETGLLFDAQTEASIVAAINRFETEFVHDPFKIRSHACNFSLERFRHEFRVYVDEAASMFFADIRQSR